VLRQGQHVGLFGLRKVGKTSLIYQLRQHLAATPTVFIDCQALPPKADALLSEIQTQLFKELPTNKHLPATGEDFRTTLIQMHEKWQKAGHHGPFILIFDEVDKLFPDRRIRGSEDILAEWVKLFRILRGLAQERKCLATLVTAYRPDVNTQNKLSPEIGENPMFMSFQEYFLGTLNQADTEQMVSEIGGWKNIRWTPDSLSEVYELCGGHPLIARFFASDACQQGDRKEIDLQRVRETAAAIVAGFPQTPDWPIFRGVRLESAAAGRAGRTHRFGQRCNTIRGTARRGRLPPRSIRPHPQRRRKLAHQRQASRDLARTQRRQSSGKMTLKSRSSHFATD
jgi:hypothetical protein